jgi:hypothetical protein
MNELLTILRGYPALDALELLPQGDLIRSDWPIIWDELTEQEVKP